MKDLISKEEAEPLLRPLYTDLNGLWAEAWAEWDRLRNAATIPLSPTIRARTLYEAMAAGAKTTLPYSPGVKKISEDRGFIIVNIENRMMLRFKKFRNKNLQTGGVPTTQQQFFETQEQLSGQGHFDGMPPRMTVIVAGYLLNPLQTGFDRKLIACSIGRTLIWHLDISGEAGTATADIPTPKPFSPTIVASHETGETADQEEDKKGPSEAE